MASFQRMEAKNHSQVSFGFQYSDLTPAAGPGLLLQESGGALRVAWHETPETPVLGGGKRAQRGRGREGQRTLARGSETTCREGQPRGTCELARKGGRMASGPSEVPSLPPALP